MSEKIPSQENHRMEKAEHMLEEKGIIPHVRLRVEQARPGQQEGWEYAGLVTRDGDPVAEVKKGNEVLYIAPGRLAAWQKNPESLRNPPDNPNLYRGEGSARQHNATMEELKQGRQESSR